VWKPLGDLGRAVGGIGELLGEGWPVELGVGVLEVGDELGALPHEEGSSSQQLAGLAFVSWADVCHREQSAAEHGRQLGGVDLVGLGLAAVDHAHVPGVAEDEGDRVVLAQVGQPVPGEHALDSDDQAVAEGLHGVEEGLGLRRQVLREDGLALLVEDVDEHASGVQIDAGVKSVLSGVAAHVSCLRGDGPS